MKLAVVPIDLEPGGSQRAPGHPLRRLIEGAMGYGDDVSSRSPSGLHGQADGRARRSHIDNADIVHAVADDRQRRLALEARVEAQLHRLAGAIARLVEIHVEKVRRVGRLVARPPDREGQAGLRRSRRDRAHSHRACRCPTPPEPKCVQAHRVRQ